MNSRPELGFDSYDRFFPNQDRMPSGGFGNLIALPLQKESRKKGNSEFVDRAFVPFADQWMLLSNVRKIQKDRILELVKEAEQNDLILGVKAVPDEDDKSPWLLPPSKKSSVKISGQNPASIEIVLSHQIYVPKNDLSPSLRGVKISKIPLHHPLR